MIIAARLLSGLVLVFNVSAAYSEDLMSGTYESKSRDESLLRVIVDGRHAGVTVKTRGCLGSVEGYLARNRKGELFLVSSSYEEDMCAIAIEPHGRFSFSMREGPECSDLHGFACSFNGFMERVR